MEQNQLIHKALLSMSHGASHCPYNHSITGFYSFRDYSYTNCIHIASKHKSPAVFSFLGFTALLTLLLAVSQLSSHDVEVDVMWRSALCWFESRLLPADDVLFLSLMNTRYDVFLETSLSLYNPVKIYDN